MSETATDTGAVTNEPGDQAQVTEGAKPAETAASAQTTTQPAGETKPAEQAVDYTFKAPDGVSLDESMVAEFTALAKDAKLPADKAQAVVDMGVKLMAKQAEAHAAMVDGWVAEIKADKVLGGDKLPETLATAGKVYSLLPAEESAKFKEYLNTTGLGNHPSMIRLLHAVGKSLSEDRFVPGGNAPRTTSSKFYENSNMN